MLKHFCRLIAFAVVVFVAGCAPIGVGSAGGGSPPANKVLLAKMGGAGGGPQGTVQLEEQDGHKQLTVDITGGAPGATFNVSVNGMMVLSVTLDESGNAHLQFDSQPDQSNESPLPSEFPAVHAGDNVQLGDMSGNFEDHDNGDANSSGDEQADNQEDGNTEDGDVNHVDDGGAGDTNDNDANSADDGEANDSNDDAADNADDAAGSDGATDDVNGGSQDNPKP